MPGEVNPDTNFKVIDKRSPETQARVAEMPEADHIGDVNEMVLKPCPFCGGEASIDYMGSDDCYPECENCSTTGKLCNTEPEAIAAWNRRTPEPGTGVVRWATVDIDNPATYPAMCTHVLVAVGGGVEYMFYSAKPDRREWISENGERFAFGDGDMWAYLPEPPEGMG